MSLTLIKNSSTEDKKNVEFLSVKEIADFLKISIQTVYQWSSLKKIPSKKVNGRLLFNKEEVLAYYNI